MKHQDIINIVLELYPNEKLDLTFSSPFELLVAAILSAQAKDEVVNSCTVNLFKDFNSPEKFSSASPEMLKPYISRINFWYKKALTIIDVSKKIVDKFGGRVPDSYDELISIRGIGSKTANMVLAGAFGKPSVIVDTHFQRVSKRLGIVPEHLDPSEIERFVKEIVPQDKLVSFSLALIRHGKKVCTARAPKCDVCKLKNLCTFFRDKSQKKRR